MHESIGRRRQVLTLGAGASLAVLVPAWARAQSAWPSRPISIVVPNAAGGPGDTIARAVSASMGRELGTSIVVDNKPGAAGKIGIQTLLRAPRDGHTIAITSITALAALPVFDPQVGYQSPSDFAPLTLAVRTPGIWCVHPSTGIDSLSRLLDRARANPGALNYASFGINSSAHLAQEDFFRRLDIRLTHVPFKGESEGLTALLAGQVQVMMISGAAKPHIDAGKLIALATTSSDRWDVFPQVPTARESGLPQLAGYSYEPWLGFSAAAGVPADIAARLQAALRNALRSEEASTTLRKLGFRVTASTSQEMSDAIVQDITIYRALLQSGRVRIE